MTNPNNSRPSLPPLSSKPSRHHDAFPSSTLLPPIQPSPANSSHSALSLLATSASSSNNNSNSSTNTNPNSSSINASPPSSNTNNSSNVSNANTATNSGPSSTSSSTNRPRRKKVDHACVYCRRSHMTCDENRPCTRCIRRNIGHLCHDEPKKKGLSPSQTPGSPSISGPGINRVDKNNGNNNNNGSGIGAMSHGEGASSNSNNSVSISGISTSTSNTNNGSNRRRRSGHAGGDDQQQGNDLENTTSEQLPSTLHQPSAMVLTSQSPSSNLVFQQIEPRHQLSKQESSSRKTGSSPDLKSMLLNENSSHNNNTNNNSMNSNNNNNNSNTNISSHRGSFVNDWFGAQSILSQTSEVNQNLFFSEHANSEFASLGDFLTMIESPDLLLDSNPNPNNSGSVGVDGGNASGSASLNLSSPELSRKASAADMSKLSQALGLGMPNNNNNTSNENPNGSSAQPIAPTNTNPYPSFQQPLPLPQHQSNNNDTTINPTISDSARDKFFLTAADPTVDVSPEERLKQVIRAKVDAGLLQPFNYARGYARLQQYMDNYMNQSSRKRILKPLSVFRPAFRAIAQSLLDVDLVLVEESFERMLLDYDRVFTSMAIPACLWRRTGEIYRGNKEFAGLVEVSVDDLRDGKLAIYELMSEESAVNYWEKYGSIAFDPSQKAVLTSCNLRARDGRKRRACCFSFTIQRDRYNIPSCIVGNFIPIHP